MPVDNSINIIYQYSKLGMIVKICVVKRLLQDIVIHPVTVHDSMFWLNSL